MIDELRPDQVGPYRLTAQLGAGGMGQVFLGVSPSGDKVAVKLLNPDLADSAVYRERFAREVAAAKRVSGRHTAQVVDADPDAASPWLATEYYPGPTLHELVRDDGVLDAAALRRLGAALAEGLAAIHSCGLVHRDLKPGNVIMAADGPRIIDFGVAQAADASTLTGTGAVVGTYAFTSPEQIRADQAGPASDVFTLGSVLVFAATGKSPFDASTIPVIVHRILSQTPDLDAVPRELRRLIGECLAKDPTARPSPTAVASLLSGDLDATTLEATKVELPPVVRPRGVSRRSLIFGGAAVAATAAIAVPTILLLPDDGSDTKPHATLSGHKGRISAAIFIDDDKLIATSGEDKTIRLWKAATGKQVTRVTGYTGGVTSLCYDPEGWNILIGGGGDGTLRAWDLEDDSLAEVVEVRHGGVTGLAQNMFGDIACGLDDGGVQVWQVNEFAVKRELAGHTGKVASVASTNIDIDGESTPIAISASAEGHKSSVRIWNMDTGTRLADLTGHTDDILHVTAQTEVTQAGYVASASKDKTVRLWDPAAGNSVGTLKGHTELVYGVAFDSQETLASGSADGTVRLWKASTGEHLRTLTGGPKHPSAVAINRDGTIVVAGDKLWRLS